ncbi:MAG: hypothetical protein ACT4PZ_20025 [Panacagrimonas sp.]
MQPQYGLRAMPTLPVFVQRGLQATILLCAACSLQSCLLLLPAVGAAPLAGGLLPSNNKIVVDETTVTPELKAALSKAKKLIFLSAEEGDRFTAEYLEQHADYIVTLEDPPKAASPSQRRELMESICRKAGKSDVVLSFSSTESDAGAMTSLKGGLLGRSQWNLTMSTDVLSCRNKERSSFLVTAEMSQGIFNADQTAIDQILGVEYAKAIMQIAGRSPPPEAK